MGLEIRSVPLDYVHPTWADLRDAGHRLPEHFLQVLERRPGRIHELAGRYDTSWREAVLEWESRRPQEDDFGAYEYLSEKYPKDTYDQILHSWMTEHPSNPVMYFPEIPVGTEMGIQIWENVSEGTPCSPVFKTEEEMVQWLMGSDRPKPYDPYWIPSNFSEPKARAFVENKWAPSMVIEGGVAYRGIDSVAR